MKRIEGNVSSMKIVSERFPVEEEALCVRGCRCRRGMKPVERHPEPLLRTQALHQTVLGTAVKPLYSSDIFDPRGE